MRAHEAQKFSNIAATTAAFVLEGGLYQCNVVATWGGGNVTLQQLGPDGSTYLNLTQSFTANGGQTVYLPPGQYRVAVVTATAVYVIVCRIPAE